MDDATLFTRIFGDHERRDPSADRLRIRDADFIADLQARVSGLAAEQNRVGGDWQIAFSPVRIDLTTETSLFEAVLTSAAEGERRLPFTVGRDWVQMGGGAMESSVRGNAANLRGALERGFRQIVLRARSGVPDHAVVEPVQP